MEKIKRIILGVFMMITQVAWSQGGIDFFHGSFAEAQEKADETGKLIFMDGFATWCGPCKYMSANTFTDSQVGDLFNTFFINMKVDMERGEGPRLARMYRVRAYPTLFIMDSGGQVLEKVEGAMGPEQFFNWAIAAISKYAPELFERQNSLKEEGSEEIQPEVVPEDSRIEESPWDTPVKEFPADSRMMETDPWDEVIAEIFETDPWDAVIEEIFEVDPRDAIVMEIFGEEEPAQESAPRERDLTEVAKTPPPKETAKSPFTEKVPKSSPSNTQKPTKPESPTSAKKPIEKVTTTAAKKPTKPVSPTSAKKPTEKVTTTAANTNAIAIDKGEAMGHNLPLYSHHPLEGVEEKLIEAIKAKDRAKMMKLSHQLLEVEDMERKMLFVEAWRAWALTTDDVPSMVINISEMLSQTEKKSPLLLNNAAWYVFEMTDDDDALELAAKWAEESIKMKPDYYNYDTFAHLMFVAGEMALAREYGNKSISLAKEKGQDHARTLELLAQIPN